MPDALAGAQQADERLTWAREVVEASPQVRTFIRQLANVGYSTRTPVEVVGGRDEPKLEGESFHYRNKSGHRIHHPNAYRRAWGKPVYHHSTLRITVGAEWVLSNALAFSLMRKK